MNGGIHRLGDGEYREKIETHVLPISLNKRRKGQHERVQREKEESELLDSRRATEPVRMLEEGKEVERQEGAMELVELFRLECANDNVEENRPEHVQSNVDRDVDMVLRCQNLVIKLKGPF